MTTASYIFGIASAVLVLVIVVVLLRRRRLRERHAIWWVIAALLALVVGIFPSTLEWVASLIGITVPTNLIFFVSIAILFFICLQQASEVTALEAQARNLAERVALQDVRLRELERRQGAADAEPDGRGRDSTR